MDEKAKLINPSKRYWKQSRDEAICNKAFIESHFIENKFYKTFLESILRGEYYRLQAFISPLYRQFKVLSK